MGLCPGQANYPPLLPQGKVFPKLRKRGSTRSVDVDEMGTGWATDYVFRIIYPGHRHEHSECPILPLWRKTLRGWGRTASPRRGSRQGPLTRPGSVLSLSLGLLLQIIPLRICFSSTCCLSLPLSPPRLLTQLIQESVHNILLVIHSRPTPGEECGKTRDRGWRTLHFTPASCLTATRWPGCRISASFWMVHIVH